MDEIKPQESQIIPDKQENTRNPDGTFRQGISGNLAGRPKGKTIKERVREWLEEHPDDMKAFVEHFVQKDRELAWQMLEGRPQQDIVSDGKALPTPIYGGLSINELPEHNSDKESLPT